MPDATLPGFRDRFIRLYTRGKSKVVWAEIRIPKKRSEFNGTALWAPNEKAKSLRFSTGRGEDDAAQAFVIAQAKLDELKKVVDAGLNPFGNKFGNILPEYLHWRQTTKVKQISKQGQKQYIRTCENVFLDFFRNKPVTMIDDNMMLEFWEWYQANRVEPTKNNFKHKKRYENTHLVRGSHVLIMRDFLKYCVSKRYISEVKVSGAAPRARHEKTQRRAHLTSKQVELLRTRLFERLERSRNYHISKRYQFVFQYAYFEMLLGTGMRPLTEMNSLYWGDLQVYRMKGVTQIKTAVHEGKTGPRTINVSVDAYKALNLLYEVQVEAFGKVKENDKIFRTFAGNQMAMGTHLGKTLRQLIEADTDRGGNRISVYSLRHTFITQAISEGAPIEHIAQQCGNSARVIQKTYNHFIVTDRVSLIPGMGATKRETEEFPKMKFDADENRTISTAFDDRVILTWDEVPEENLFPLDEFDDLEIVETIKLGNLTKDEEQRVILYFRDRMELRDTDAAERHATEDV